MFFSFVIVFFICHSKILLKLGISFYLLLLSKDKRGLKKLTQQRRLKASPDSSGVKGRTNKSFNKNLASSNLN
jgi:hypothetical protein